MRDLAQLHGSKRSRLLLRQQKLRNDLCCQERRLHNSSASLRSSSSGSENSASLSTGTASNSGTSNDLPSMEEDRDLNTTSSLSNSIGGSAVDEMSSVGGSDVDADSTSSYVEADVPTAASPTPTEDLSNEDAVKACIKPRRTRAMVLTMEELARAAQLGGKHIMEEVSWRELMDMSYEAGGVYPTIMGYALGAIAVLFFSRCSTWSLQWLLLVAAGTGVCCTYVQLASLDLVHEHFVSKKVVIKSNKRKKHD
ncbi:hypothetical protein JG687_00001444 [Phytophthora cactorum]|uniref:Uncharacterized protein n=1 Tax=Phytophthora cactorum TaxID=29920 RepID=A0A8T1UXX1_9STRA|nr:hypothetical protein JG687_00001444 [Phytophthora cactorum]